MAEFAFLTVHNSNSGWNIKYIKIQYHDFKLRFGYFFYPNDAFIVHWKVDNLLIISGYTVPGEQYNFQYQGGE